MASFTNSTILASSFLRFRAVAVAPGTAPTQPPPVTFQQGWRCCGGCRGLVYADGPDPGPCVAGGRHATGASATGSGAACGAAAVEAAPGALRNEKPVTATAGPAPAPVEGGTAGAERERPLRAREGGERGQAVSG